MDGKVLAMLEIHGPWATIGSMDNKYDMGNFCKVKRKVAHAHSSSLWKFIMERVELKLPHPSSAHHVDTAQEPQLNTYLPEFLQKLDAGVRRLELTQWKQSTATEALASPPFADLDISIMPSTDWFKTIVRKFTNYFNNVYKRSHEEEPSASVLIKSNPLLRFTSILSGLPTPRTYEERIERNDEKKAKQRVAEIRSAEHRLDGPMHDQRGAPFEVKICSKVCELTHLRP
ncbi:hypothetical protein B0H14DRAFT_3704802 [Mycena olivaceomarginata]|nr:hypothetical protein B0H14DRAFT_3704802 [Mycena olivaceomarginata]